MLTNKRIEPEEEVCKGQKNNPRLFKNISPFFRIPITDMNSSFINCQTGPCARFELAAMECLEAYGMDRAEKKCALLFQDMEECIFRDKSTKRFKAMQAERERQIKAGILKGDEKYVPIQVDSY